MLRSSVRVDGFSLQPVNPSTNHGVHSCGAASAAYTDAFGPNDTIVAEMATGLNLDQYHRHLACVIHPVRGTERDINRLVFRDGHHCII